MLSGVVLYLRLRAPFPLRLPPIPLRRDALAFRGSVEATPRSFAYCSVRVYAALA